MRADDRQLGFVTKHLGSYRISETEQPGSYFVVE